MFDTYSPVPGEECCTSRVSLPIFQGGGCLLTQCDRTTLFLGGCVLMTIPISEDTLLPSHTVRNVVSADCTVVIAIAIAYSYRLCKHRVRNAVPAVLAHRLPQEEGVC